MYLSSPSNYYILLSAATWKQLICNALRELFICIYILYVITRNFSSCIQYHAFILLKINAPQIAQQKNNTCLRKYCNETRTVSSDLFHGWDRVLLGARYSHYCLMFAPDCQNSDKVFLLQLTRQSIINDTIPGIYTDICLAMLSVMLYGCWLCSDAAWASTGSTTSWGCRTEPCAQGRFKPGTGRTRSWHRSTRQSTRCYLPRSATGPGR